MSRQPAKHVPRRAVAITFASFALSIMAILLWGRIKLVAGVPRTAYAEPKAAAPAAPGKTVRHTGH